MKQGEDKEVRGSIIIAGNYLATSTSSLLKIVSSAIESPPLPASIDFPTPPSQGIMISVIYSRRRKEVGGTSLECQRAISSNSLERRVIVTLRESSTS